MEKINIDEPVEIRPNLSANVLFHFMSELRFLCRAIEMKALFPRYCRENITYLDLKLDEHRITEVAYPEKCFCDIPVHKVLEHTSNYGEYGIGLPKDWGIKQGIQPIQYVNPKSHLIRDFRKAFEKRTTISEGNYDAQYISNYLVSYMLYIKPLTGKNLNRKTKVLENVYFPDECEWRYVPDLTEKEMPTILLDNDICKKDEKQKLIIDMYNEALEKLSDTWLAFDYADIKYFTVNTYEERDMLIEFIYNMDNGVDKAEKLKLISKIIVLNDAKEDF